MQNDDGLMPTEGQTFWDHLDVLRSCLWRILLAMVAGGITAFCLKEPIFSIVLAPSCSDFPLYKWLGAEAFSLHLINTGLTEQMMIHLKVALSVGVLLVSPYIIYVLYGFVAPALYAHERRYSLRLTLAGYAMFMVGVTLNYLLLFPLTVRFLGTYQVSAEVENLLTISSYVDTLLTMSLVFGAVSEMPVLSWLLGRMGVLRAKWMRHFRRHAIVAILVVAAIVTPTADAFTLMVVSLPIWLLYEVSIFIVGHTNKLS